MIPVWDAGRALRRHLGAVFGDLRAELAELSPSAPSARICAMSSLAVVSTVVITSMLHMDDLWWAALSATRAMQANFPASFQRAVLRMIGTTVGAGAALLVLPFVAYDPVAYALVLWIAATASLLGYSVSSHGYAFLFGGITFALVTLSSLQDPPSALLTAVNRVMEVGVGCAVAVVVAWMLAPGVAKPVPPPAGWRDLLGEEFPAVRHAVRGGFAMAVVPFIWRWLDLPSIVQMPITIVAVMAVPFAVTRDARGRDQAVLSKSLLRVIGCVIGGAAGLLVLALSLTSFPVLLGFLGAGIWVGTHVEASKRGIGYIGTQGTMAFLMTLVQGAGPPTSILPGIDRLAGIFCGLAILVAVTTLLEFLSPLPPVAAVPGPEAKGIA